MAVGFAALSIIPFLLLTFLLVMALRAVVIAITPPRRGVKVPSCEKCRYPVAGLTTLACPECGADLRITGIITRAMEMRRRGSTLGAIAWHTVFCLILAMIASYLVLFLVGMSVATATTTITTPVMPTSKAYQSITLLQSTGPATPTVSATLTLNDGSTRVLTVQNLGVGNPTATLRDAAGAEISSVPFDELTASRFFEDAGIDTADATVAAEATELTRLLDACLAANWSPPTNARLSKLSLGGSTFGGTSAPTPLADRLPQLLAIAVPLLLWVFGLIIIVFRRKKLLREAAAADRPPALA